MKKIIFTTSWDDGHFLDVKFATLLKKYHIKATFYISPENKERPAMNKIQIKQLSDRFTP